MLEKQSAAQLAVRLSNELHDNREAVRLMLTYFRALQQNQLHRGDTLQDNKIRKT